MLREISYHQFTYTAPCSGRSHLKPSIEHHSLKFLSKIYHLGSGDGKLGSRDGTLGSRDGTLGSRDGTSGSRDGTTGSRDGALESRDGTLESRETNISKFQFDPGMHSHF